MPGRQGPFTRLLTAASLLVAGAAVMVTSPVLTSSPASANGCPAAAGNYATGDGSSATPFQIATTEQLLRLAATSADWNKHFVQTADINLSGCTWPGIGGAGSNPFTGTYDGGGKTISNVSISASTDYWGLFRNTSGATLKDLTLDGVTISASGRSYIGALVGWAQNSTIDNVTASGVDIEGGYEIGGMAGRAQARSSGTVAMTNVEVAGVVTGAESVGGLVGEIEGGFYIHPGLFDTSPTAIRIADATSSATVTSTSSNYTGGLVGEAGTYGGGVTLSGVSASGNVTSVYGYVGGLIGSLYSYKGGSVTVIDANASGNVTGVEHTGGLLGGADIRDAGSIIVAGSTSTGPVANSDANTGGLIGYVYSFGNATLTVVDSSARGAVNGTAQVGGLIGYLRSGDPSGSNGGPITITRSWAAGAVTGSAAAGGVGGLIGELFVQPTTTGDVTVSASAALGNVNGSNTVGGLLGRHNATSGTLTLNDVYAAGSVTATGDMVGGLLGNVSTGATVARAYARGAVSGASEVGGFIGLADPGVSVTASFWDSETSLQSTSAGGGGVQPATTADLKNVETFSGATWSISDGEARLSRTWAICSGSTYPFLMWQNDLAAGLPGAAPCALTPVTEGGGDNTSSGQLPPPATPTTTTTSTTTTTTTTTTTVPPTTTVAPVTSTPPPVLINGALPELQPGDIVVVEDGEPVAVEVFVENDTELVMQSTNFDLRLKGDCSTGACVIDTTPDGREVLTLEENGATNVRGVGFQPGSEVDVWLFSEPRYLGALTVNPDGTFDGDMDLGDIDPGEHTLQVNGVSQTGAERSANLGVIVNAQAAPTPEPGVLPATGASNTPIWLIALVLLGLGLVTVTRRRTA